MLELIYIGCFDYLARHDIREAPYVPDDAAVEAARRDLETSRGHSRLHAACDVSSEFARQPHGDEGSK